jgi:penicillin amidase
MVLALVLGADVLASGTLGPTSCQISENPEVTAIESSNKLEGFYCWGLLHSRERGHQMQVLRQTGRGRLAEDRGMEFVKGDFSLRLMELEPRARRLAAGMPVEDRELLDAYSQGVNDGNPGIFGKDRWSPADTVLFVLLQSFDQTRRTFEQDIVTDRHARASDPLSGEFPWQTPILKDGEYLKRPQEPTKRSSGLFPFAPEDGASGSNNWVVSARHSRTGHALLANDPHLQLKSPPFWHWLQISWPGVKLVGAGVPGVPLVASGASSHLAWGLTNSYVDVSDAVLVPRESLQTRTIRPVVWVKKWGLKLPIFFKSFEIVKGADLPVLPIESPLKDHAIVVRSTVFDLKPTDLSPLWRISEAKSARELDEDLARVGVPSWNFVFADTDGNIGYRVVGRLPKRSWRDLGTMEVVKASELRPFDVLSKDEAPHVLNPSRGWVATANQLQWGSDGLNSVGWNHTESFRGFRIEELLRAGLRDKHSVESFQRIQCDRQAVDARFLLPVLLAGIPRTPTTERLASWNFDTGLECQECALFRLWMKELGDPQWTYARARQGTPVFWKEAEFALARAEQKLVSTHGTPWVKWGEIHRAAFSMVEALRPFPLRLAEALPTFGDDHSVSPGSSDWTESETGAAFSHHSGASQRLIVELSSPPRIHWILPGANRSSEGPLEKEKATSPDRKAWAGCRLKELTRWSNGLGGSAGNPRRPPIGSHRR